MRRKVWVLLFAVLLFPVTAMADLSAGLVAYYPFDGNTNDATGNGNNGIPQGGPAYTSGYSGQAVVLDGVDDLIQLPAALMKDDFSVAFWVNTTATAPNGTLWFEGYGIVDGEVCGSPAGGDFGIALMNGGKIFATAFGSTSDVNNGVWHAAVVTRSGATGQVQVYIDGKLERTGIWGTGPITGMPWIGVGNNPCTGTTPGSRWFPGLVDELRFYNRVLTSSEVLEFSGKAIPGVSTVPTMNEWGMIIFMVLAGLGAVYYMRRQRRTES